MLVAEGATAPDVAVSNHLWFRRLDSRIHLDPGTPAPDVLKVPAADAEHLLRQTVRLVADVPRGASPDVVWTLGANELLIRTAAIGLSCLRGLVTLGFSVRFSVGNGGPGKDDVTLRVPLGVGTAQAPSGLIRPSLNRLAGPKPIVEAWSATLTAFAWESVVDLARQLCAAVGSDAAGRPLIPGSIASSKGVLLIRPMARQRGAGRRQR